MVLYAISSTREYEYVPPIVIDLVACMRAGPRPVMDQTRAQHHPTRAPYANELIQTERFRPTRHCKGVFGSLWAVWSGPGEKIAARLDAHNTPWWRSARALNHPSRRHSENVRIGSFPRARLCRGKRRLEISPGRTRGEIAGDAA
jgi:hypothetical protein